MPFPMPREPPMTRAFRLCRWRSIRASTSDSQRYGSDLDQLKGEAVTRLGKAGRRDAARQDDIAGPERCSRLRQVIGEPCQGNEGVAQHILAISTVDLDAVELD